MIRDAKGLTPKKKKRKEKKKKAKGLTPPNGSPAASNSCGTFDR
jgi:hypothetical protein